MQIVTNCLYQRNLGRWSVGIRQSAEDRRKRGPYLVYHLQRNKRPLPLLLFLCDYTHAHLAYTHTTRVYSTSCNKSWSHTPCALSRSLVRLPSRSLVRSLAASGFEISAAVVDVRCPRSDRGPGTRREPRRSRSRSIDRLALAESSSVPHFVDRENPLDEARTTCPHKAAEDGHGFVICLTIDRSNRDPACRRDQTPSIPREGERVRGRVEAGDARTRTWTETRCLVRYRSTESRQVQEMDAAAKDRRPDFVSA